MNDLGESRLRMLLGRYYMALQNLKYYIAAAPAVIVTLVIIGLLLQASLVPADIRSRYLNAARDAMVGNRMDLAKVYYGRLIEEGEVIDPQDEMNWAMILSANGEGVAAQRIVERLAPDDRPGYGPAHRERAAQLVRGIGNSSDPTQMERLQFHLNNIGDVKSADVEKMWSAFYFAVGQPKSALGRLKTAAAQEPDLWPRIAGLAKQTNDQELFKEALTKSETYYQRLLEKNPFDAKSRDFLAGVYLTSDRFDEAQELIDQGLKLQNIPAIHRSAANLLLIRFDKLRQSEPDNFDAANRLLAEAFNHDPNNPEIYNRMVRMYQQLDSDQQRAAVRESLESLIAEGNVTPFAHFSLGSIAWLDSEQDQALWHLEKAYELDASLLNVANNLAWVLASLEVPDLERAHQLASSALAQAPDDVNLRDTLATVLLKQQKWDEALVEFERILPQSQSKKRIHESLATIYNALGRQSLAEMHQERAISAAN